MRKLIRKWIKSLGFVDKEELSVDIPLVRLDNVETKIKGLNDWVISHTELNANTSRAFLDTCKGMADEITELSHKLADLRLVVQELQATEDALELNTPKVRVVKVKGKNAYQLKYITEKPTHYVIGTNKGYATIKSISKGIERKVKIWTPKKEA